MRVSRLAYLILLTTVVFAATPGEFRGVIVGGEATAHGWILVQGRNHLVRKVALRKATVVYSEEVPAHKREHNAVSSLQQGAEVRILATQDSAGEWQASRVEVLKLAPPEGADDSGRSAKI